MRSGNFETRMSKSEREPRRLTFPQNRGKDVHQFPCFGEQPNAGRFHLDDPACIKETKPIGRFLRLFAAGLNPEQKVLPTHGFVRFDVIRSDRSRTTAQLPNVFEVPGSLREPFTSPRVSFAKRKVRSSKSYGRRDSGFPFSSIPAIQPLIVSNLDIRIWDFPYHDYTT